MHTRRPKSAHHSLKELGMYTGQGNQGALSRTLYQVQDDVFSKRQGIDLPATKTLQGIKALVARVHDNAVVRQVYPEFAYNTLPPVHLIERLEMSPFYVETARTDIRLRELFFTNNQEGTSDDTILHELAHIIELDRMGGYTQLKQMMQWQYDPHGREFAKTFAFLLDNFIGGDKAAEFRSLLTLTGVLNEN